MHPQNMNHIDGDIGSTSKLDSQTALQSNQAKSGSHLENREYARSIYSRYIEKMTAKPYVPQHTHAKESPRFLTPERVDAARLQPNFPNQSLNGIASDIANGNNYLQSSPNNLNVVQPSSNESNDDSKVQPRLVRRPFTYKRRPTNSSTEGVYPCSSSQPKPCGVSKMPQRRTKQYMIVPNDHGGIVHRPDYGTASPYYPQHYPYHDMGRFDGFNGANMNAHPYHHMRQIPPVIPVNPMTQNFVGPYEHEDYAPPYYAHARSQPYYDPPASKLINQLPTPESSSGGFQYTKATTNESPIIAHTSANMSPHVNFFSPLTQQDYSVPYQSPYLHQSWISDASKKPQSNLLTPKSLCDSPENSQGKECHDSDNETHISPEEFGDDGRNKIGTTSVSDIRIDSAKINAKSANGLVMEDSSEAPESTLTAENKDTENKVRGPGKRQAIKKKAKTLLEPPSDTREFDFTAYGLSEGQAESFRKIFDRQLEMLYKSVTDKFNAEYSSTQIGIELVLNYLQNMDDKYFEMTLRS